jgi:hypothetical protein
MDLTFWFLIWFAIWGVFNLFVRWPLEKFKSFKFAYRGVFFLLLFALIQFVFEGYLKPFHFQILISVLLVNAFGILVGFEKIFYKNFKKDRFFLLFQTFNILLQQAMVVVALGIITDTYGESYRDLRLGLIFLVAHFPIVLLPWAKMKYYLFASTFFAGMLFSYLIRTNTFGLVISFTIHFCLYIYLINKLKDERKI